MNRFLFLFITYLLLTINNSVFGANTLTWNGGSSGQWGIASNWLPTIAPDNGDHIIFNYSVSLTRPAGSFSPNLGSLSLNNATISLSSNFASMTISGSTGSPAYTLKMVASSIVPSIASFTLNVTGSGFVSLTGASTLGTNTSSTSTIYPVTVTNGRTTGDDISDQTVIVDNTTFNGAFTCTANCYRFTLTTFNGASTITKTSNVYSVNNGSNSFNSTATLINNGNGILSWGNGDTFNSATAQVSLNNTSAGFFIIASSGVTSPYNRTVANFYGPVTSSNTGTGSIIFSNSLVNTVNFNGTSSPLKNIFFNNTSSGEVRIGNGGAVAFKYSNVYLGSTGSGTTYVGYTPSSPPGASPRVSVEGTSSFNTVISGTTPLFTSGELHIDRFDLLASTAYPTCSLTCNTSAAVNLKTGIRTNRDFIVNAFRIIGIGGNYNKTTSFTLSSGASYQQTNTYSVAAVAGTTGDNLTFNNNVSFINAASNTWTIGGSNVSPTSTSSNHTINFNPPNSSSRSSLLIQTNDIGDIQFGYLPCTINITNSNFRIKRNIARASILFGFSANINVISTDPAAPVWSSNTNLRTDLAIEQFGEVSIYNYAISLGTNSGTFTFNGILTTTDFKGGNLSFGRFITSSDITAIAGTSPHAETLITITGNAVFNRNSTFTAPNIKATGGTFGPVPTVSPKVMSPSYVPTYLPSDYPYTSTFNRTSGAAAGNDNYFTGSPVFNGAVSIYNSSASNFVFGNISTDVFAFNSGVTVYRSGTGNVRTSGAGLSYYNGNYTYYGTPSDMAGKSVFKGLIDQSITCSLPVIRFNILEIKKTDPISPALLNDVVLVYPASVGGTTSSQLILTYGNIRTTSTNLLTIDDGATITTTSEVSFVDGPLKKTGRIPGTVDFTFPIGKNVVSGSTVNRMFMPVSMTIPVSIGSTYTAEFFNQNQSAGNAIGSTIADVQNCQYWTISHTGPNENIAVTLFWNNLKVCYPVNLNVVCVAQYQGTTTGQWQNAGFNMIGTFVNYSTVKSDVLANQLTGNYIYFSIGYRNALVLNTVRTNPTLYKVLNHTESLPSKFISGPAGTSAGDKTVVSAVNNVPGMVVIHPDFGANIDIKIDQTYKDPLLASADPRADALTYESLDLKLYTNTAGAIPVCTLVTAKETGTTYTPLSDQYHTKGASVLSFYKQRQEDNTYVLLNNLSDGITFPVNVSGITNPFRILNVPSGVTTATLQVKDLLGTTVLFTTTINPLSWDGKVSGVYVAEGVYNYVLTLNVSSQNYVYNGQLIVKYQ